MNGQDLEIAQTEAYKSMENSNDLALEYDTQKAELDEQYEIALAEKMFALRLNGQPVSMVEKLAKGDSEVAHIKYLASVAEANARANKENINLKKKMFDSLEATKKRELG